MKVLVIAAVADMLVNFRRQLLMAMVAAGHQVTAAIAEEDQLAGLINRDATGVLRAIGVDYITYPLARTGLNPMQDLTTYRALKRVVKQVEPDVVFSYTMKSVLYGSMAAHRCGVRHIHGMFSGLGAGLRGGDSLGARARVSVIHAMCRVALAHNESVIFQNPDDAVYFAGAKLLAPHTQTVVVNGSGVDLDHFGQAAPVTDPPTFLLVSRLLREKGVADYVQAAAIVKERHPHARCLLLGPIDPHANAVTADELRAWQDAGTIEYLGSAHDVRPALASSSVFVLPTYYGEGTPRTILEALAMGRPIITTDTPGCRETVTPGENGYLVPPRDPQALAEAMEQFLVEPGRIATMGAASRQVATEKYNVHDVNAAMMHALGLDRQTEPARALVTA